MKFESLKKSREFSNVYKNGKSFANRYLIMYILPNECSGNRLGISVSKKVGNSVVRHRITRLIRESYRLHADKIYPEYDIVVVARVAANGRSYKEIESAFLHLLKLHHLLKQGWLLKIIKRFFILCIRFYQKFLSPLKGGATCRYRPCCSQYALEAVEKHGPIKGMLLAVWRVLRCNPFSKGGYDPVPWFRRLMYVFDTR